MYLDHIHPNFPFHSSTPPGTPSLSLLPPSFHLLSLSLRPQPTEANWCCPVEC